MRDVRELLNQFKGVRRNSRGWTARCPAHDDHRNSLSISIGSDGKILLYCFVGCSFEAILAEVDIAPGELFPQQNENRRGAGGLYHPRNGATVQPSSVTSSKSNGKQVVTSAPDSSTTQSEVGCTLEQYAEAKRLPAEYLRQLGLTDCSYSGKPAVRIPYSDENDTEGPVRFRLALYKTESHDERFRWRTNSKLMLYGLDRLDRARQAGYAVLVEGESDCHTLWYYEIPAFGIPGANNWKEDWANYFNDIEKIYVIIEPDRGGEAMRLWLSRSRIRDRVYLVEFGEAKDPSELHCANPDRFLEHWNYALRIAVAWKDIERDEKLERKREAWQQCAVIARMPSILDYFAETLSKLGVAGEIRTAKVIFLAIISRFLKQPVSVTVKGPSSSGKSFIVERVLLFFPPSAYYSLSGMSERALAYSDEPIAHRFLVLYEAAGLSGEFASYLLRSLLSEGRVRYETVDKPQGELRSRLIEREGPTGFITTTTSISLHPENETRLLSLPVTDTQEQTREVLRKLADESDDNPNLEPWLALQNWLEQAEHRVVIPFALTLADNIPPIATRLRRDFKKVLNLIRAHALLHQAQRERREDGSIIATIDDYRVVRELIADLLAIELDAGVSQTLRETVAALQKLTAEKPGNPVSNADIARQLKLDNSTALRRVQAAIRKGFIRNLEDRRGREAKLVIGEPLPEDVSVLPLPEALEGDGVVEDCKDPATNETQSYQQDNTEGCRVALETTGYTPSIQHHSLGLDAKEIEWRARVMREQIPESGPIPLLVAREAVEPGLDDCLSCGETLGEGDDSLCVLCGHAKTLAIELSMSSTQLTNS